MKTSENTGLTSGGSVFWMLMIVVAIFSLVYLGIWSYFAESIKGTVIFSIFFAMIIGGVILALLGDIKLFNFGTWSQNAASFLVAFFIWGIIGGSTSKSILAISQNSLFASIASELPQNLEFIMNSFLIPIAEELFWMIGLPIVIITLMNVVAKSNKSFWFFGEKYFQVSVAALISGLTFAAFHVGQQANSSFAIGAFIFRFLTVLLVYAEIVGQIWPSLRLAMAFGLGAHIGNNLSDYGFAASVTQITQNFWPIGFIITGIFIFIILTVVNMLVEMFTKRSLPFIGKR